MSGQNSFSLIAAWALLDDGFAPDMRITVSDGTIVSVEANDGRPGERVAGALLPGMTDLHSHAFQRSFAGLAEFAGGGGDFWSWREAMYRAADRIEPDTLAPVMAYLAMQKLRGGYTGTVEFHYLQHGRGGVPYASRNAMADALVHGAGEAGIGLTVLFGIYETANFDGSALENGQTRFSNSASEALAMLQSASVNAGPDLRFGLAPHSLRAVRPASLLEAVAGLGRLDAAAPVHIHVAEQRREVEDCRAALGTTPVAWLLDHAPVGPNWCLVHATHTDAAEIAGLARSRAVAGLCPSTEGNLGDGIFGLGALHDAGGRFGIGADSNVCTDAFSELRLMENVQRLSAGKRNVLAGGDGHSGRILWQAAAARGAEASARASGRIAAGCRADFVVIEPTPEAASGHPDFWLDAAIFASDEQPARHVMAGGRWVVRDGEHFRRHEIIAAYRNALLRIAA